MTSPTHDFLRTEIFPKTRCRGMPGSGVHRDILFNPQILHGFFPPVVEHGLRELRSNEIRRESLANPVMSEKMKVGHGWGERFNESDVLRKTVVAVGLNISGQRDVSTWTDIVQVAGGYLHTVGLKSDGTVVFVGNNEDGQLDVSTWTDIAQVAAGESHTVGLKSDGTLVAVGGNWNGQCTFGVWTLNDQPELPISAQCISSKMKAAGKLCSTLLKCYAKGIKSAGAGFDPSSCVGPASAKFQAGWAKAEAKAAKKGNSCVTASDTEVEDMIVIALEDIYYQIADGLDTGNKDARKLGADLLKAAEKRSKNLFKSGTDTSFESNWNKAIGKAEKKGGGYAGPSVSDVQMMIDNLFASVQNAMK